MGLQIYTALIFSIVIKFAKSSLYMTGNIFLLKDSLEPTVNYKVQFSFKWNYPGPSGHSVFEMLKASLYKIGLR